MSNVTDLTRFKKQKFRERITAEMEVKFTPMVKKVKLHCNCGNSLFKIYQSGEVICNSCGFDINGLQE